MDAAARKSLEIQTQVRHNAQAYQSTMKDLQNWEREIKEKENSLQKTPLPQNMTTESIGGTNDLKSLPVRSHVFEKSAKQQPKQETQQKQQLKDLPKTSKHIESTVTTPDEKPESAPDPKTQNRKEANEIKDVGNRHVKFQQYDLAIEEYTRAIEMCPDEAVFYTNRALCYLKLERYEECVEDCDRAVELDKLAVKAYYRRMQANESLGNYMDALKDCTSALTIEPRNAETTKSLERINECLRKNQKSKTGPNFSPDSESFININSIDKPAYKRSSKPLRRVPIADVIGPKATKTFQNLEISDDDIDKLFNSNCGPFVEVKKTVTPNEEVKPVVPFIEQKETASSTQAIKLGSNELTASTLTLTNPKEVSENAKVSDSIITTKEGSSEHKPSVKAKEIEPLSVFQNRSLPPAPTSTAQFYTTWKELPDKQKYEYLSSINLSLLCKILGAGFDSDTLTDCLRIIHDFYLSNEDVTASATLLEISRNEEISILSLLMSKEDKKVLSEILDTLNSKQLINQETLEAIKSNFNFVLN